MKNKNVIPMLFDCPKSLKKPLLLTLSCSMLFSIPALAADPTPIPSNIIDGSLFELEGDTPNPVVENGTALKFLPLEAAIKTKNGNGWRQEYKIAKPNRLPMGATYELFKATYTVDMSDGAKSILAQHHGDKPTLMKLYYADSTENGVGGDGKFDLYVRLRDKELDGGESVHVLGELEAGESFDLIMENNYGVVTVTAVIDGVSNASKSVKVSETAADYFKFGNYLQAQVTTDTEHKYGGDKCKSLKPPITDFAECYKYLKITKSDVVLTNVSYERKVNKDYKAP